MIDTPSIDAVATRRFRASRAIALVSAMLDAVRIAWTGASARRLLMPPGRSDADRRREAAFTVLIASLVALGLQFAGASPSPGTWVFPASVAVCSLVILVRGPQQ